MKYRKSIIRFIILPLGILLVSSLLYAASIYLSDGRFFSIVKPIDRRQLIEESPSGIVGTIPRDRGQMGTVIVYFNQHDSSKGSVMFTLTEQTTDRIIYQNKYAIHDLVYRDSFPFGFPPIEQSQSKSYQFSIVPDDPDYIQVPSLSNNHYPYEILYQFNRRTLFQNPENVSFFINRKLTQYAFQMLYSRNALFYISPVILYYLGLFMRAQYKNIVKQLLIYQKPLNLAHPSLLVMISIVFVSSFLFTEYHPGFFALMSMFWILLSGYYRLQAESHFFLALALLLLSPLFLLSDMAAAASNIASWSFIFIFIGALTGIGLLQLPKIQIPYIKTFDSVIIHFHRMLLRYIS